MSVINNLQDSKLLGDLQVLSEMIVEQDLVSESRDLISTINQIFANNPDLKRDVPELYNRYQTYLMKARFVCLFELEEKEVLELMEKYLVLVLDNPFYNIYEKLRMRLQRFDSLAARDEFKNKIKESLLKNRSKISPEKIMVGTIMQEPTVANWLKDYYSKLGIDRVDALAFNQYLVNAENTKNLEESDREKLKTLFTLFEKLKISSSEAGGLEENFVAILPDKSVSLISGGMPMKIDANLQRLIDDIVAKGGATLQNDDLFLDDSAPTDSQQANPSVQEMPADLPVSPLSVLSVALEDYNPSSLEYKAIKQEIERLRKNKKDV